MGNPFEGMPFFGDLAKMLGQQGGMAWDSARQLAISVATDGTSETNVDPMDRMAIEQLARVADLHVADVTGLSTSISGRAVTALPVNRTRWVMDTLDAYRPLVERLADALGAPPSGLDEDPNDPTAGMFAGMLQMFQPMVLAMTAGSMVGHLGQRTLGQYDLPIPRPLAGPGADELLLVVPNMDAFADEWSLPREDVRLWVCVHEIAHHAVLGVPHVPRRARRPAADLRLRLPQRSRGPRGAHRPARPRRPRGHGRASRSCSGPPSSCWAPSPRPSRMRCGRGSRRWWPSSSAWSTTCSTSSAASSSPGTRC